MSQYTTGEMAKLCGVSVRTVQYYDSRNILVPTALSEGGRRLYSEEDLRKLKIICFLRSLDLPINTISQLLSEEHPETVIGMILEQQEQTLNDEVAERRQKLEKLGQLRRELKSIDHFSVESIHDIACMMENRKNLKKLRGLLFLVGIPLDIAEIGAVALWIRRGIWWPFALWLCVDLILGFWVVAYYMKRVAYICPECHTVFRANTKEAFFARHTPAARKLTCTHCGYKGFCVETYGGNRS